MYNSNSGVGNSRSIIVLKVIKLTPCMTLYNFLCFFQCIQNYGQAILTTSLMNHTAFSIRQIGSTISIIRNNWNALITTEIFILIKQDKKMQI